jgi:hypothetical protein
MRQCYWGEAMDWDMQTENIAKWQEVSQHTIYNIRIENIKRKDSKVM